MTTIVIEIPAGRLFSPWLLLTLQTFSQSVYQQFGNDIVCLYGPEVDRSCEREEWEERFGSSAFIFTTIERPAELFDIFQQVIFFDDGTCCINPSLGQGHCFANRSSAYDGMENCHLTMNRQQWGEGLHALAESLVKYVLLIDKEQAKTIEQALESLLQLKPLSLKLETDN